LFEGVQLQEVVAEAGYDVFGMGSMCCYEFYVAGFEYVFDSDFHEF
jgi:hypothetical protein